MAKTIRRLVESLETANTIMANGEGFATFPPFTVHASDGELLHANEAALFWFGADLETLKGLGFLNHVHVQDRVAAAHAFRTHDGHVSEDHLEFRPLPQSTRKAEKGVERPAWAEANIRHVAMDGGAFLVVMYRDISDIRELNHALEKLREDSEKSSIAKSRFFANVSHELRTPLNAVLGFSELLTSPMMAEIGEEKRKEYAGLIHDSASHLLAVLNDILDMSKIESGNYEILPETFNLADCIKNTVAMMRGQAELRKIDIVMAGFGDLPEIVADKRAVRQIMINLLSNAVKFSEDGQEVRVVAERLARKIKIHVEDDGIGISPENLENLGKPFFQADSKYDRKYEGTGLGLSVVKGLIDLHGGDISFKSERDSGTIVTIELPINGNGSHIRPARQDAERITSIPLGSRDAQPEHKEQAGQFKIVRKSA